MFASGVVWEWDGMRVVNGWLLVLLLIVSLYGSVALFRLLAQLVPVFFGYFSLEARILPMSYVQDMFLRVPN